MASLGWCADSISDGYAALKTKDYDRAIEAFRRAVNLEPDRIEIRKELAYTLLKIGETEEARDEFGLIVKQAASDWHSALEYGYLCHETRQIQEARRTFDRVRRLGDGPSKAAAEQAFLSVDKPAEEAIHRWTAALTHNPDDYSAHAELARAAEVREDGHLAAKHYQRAWELRPAERYLLVDLGRARKLAGDLEGANAAWIAASRGSNARAAEDARRLLPQRYPYASEFQQAINLDRANIDLRRELAFLWIAVNKPAEAEAEFVKLLEIAPDDLLSMAQLGLMRLGRNDTAAAMPLLEKVMKGSDEALARKVREVLGGTQKLKPRAASLPPQLSNKQMGDRSYSAGNLNDAERFYRAAREENPRDAEIDLRLGRTYNMLRQDDEAIRYFDLARRNGEGEVKRDAQKAYKNLRPDFARVRTTAWVYPMFSSRWHEGFTYGQWKTELRLGRLPIRPYTTLRFVGDSQRSAGSLAPQYLSESSFIAGIGVSTRQYRGLMAWAEAGSAMRYRNRSDVGRFVPDYRGGISFARGFGAGIASERAGWFFQITDDIVTLSRFRWNVLAYTQNRVGFTLPHLGPLQWQALWNFNLTFDRNREPWANFADVGPGLRLRMKSMPPSMLWSIDFLRGNYLIHDGGPRKPAYYDVRAGLWYAITR
jgi:tetratricopeptide (TPR) repeat protein